MIDEEYKKHYLGDVYVYGDTVHVDMEYPGIGDNPTFMEVSLTHVRAADNLRLHYDLTRDGWVVSQASKFEWDAEDDVCDPDWQEVAFVEAWARENESWAREDENSAT